MSPLWITIEPTTSEVRLVLTEPGLGPRLKARLPLPAQARAVPALLEALSVWCRRPLHAVLDADAEDIRLHPERWALLAGDLPVVEISVEWAQRPSPARRKEYGRYFDELGDFRSARSLLGLAATGLP
jgi:hypothetical protein